MNGNHSRKSNCKAVIWIKTKGGKVFNVEEKVAWMFTKIRKAWLDQQPLEKPESKDNQTKALPGPCEGQSRSSGTVVSSHAIKMSSSSSASSCQPLGSEENPIFLEIVRGGIFALMLRWARHHSRGYSNNLTILNQQLIDDRLVPDPHCLSTYEPCCHSSSPPLSVSSNSAPISSQSTLPLTEIPPWDQKFFSKLTKSQVFEMLQASSILGLTLLTEMLAKTVADQIRGKSPEEIRKEFNIENDFTTEEEEELKADTERMLERLHSTCDQPLAHHCALLSALGNQAQMRTLAEFMTPQKFPFISSAYTA